MKLEAIKIISIIANSAIVYASAFAMVWSAIKLKRNEFFSEDSKSLILGLFLWTLGEVLRIGWWIPSTVLAAPGSVYADFAEQYKWIVYVPATILITTGVAITMYELSNKVTSTLKFVLTSLLFGAAMVFVHYRVVY